jgi:hypothetical protein
MHLFIDVRVMSEDYHTIKVEELKISGSYEAIIEMNLGPSINQIKWNVLRAARQDEDSGELLEETDDVQELQEED